MFRGLVGLLVIETLYAFCHRVGDHRHGMIADRRVGLVAPQFPHGQSAALLIHPNECVDEIDRAFLIDDRIQRMRRTERVPEREDSILSGFWIFGFGFWICFLSFVSGRLSLVSEPVHLPINAAILSVDIAE